ncbi:MAG: DinB family protein [Gemmataceae bacterium]
MSLAEQIQLYLDAPAQLRAAVAGLSRDQLLARPIPGKMSTLEVVAHIADFEPVFADRMKRIIAMDRPQLAPGDENAFLAKLAYHERDLEDELRLIELVRAQMGRILRILPNEAWSRIGIHAERGEVTLEQMLRTANYHIPHHLPFIHEKRQALGR